MERLLETFCLLDGELLNLPFHKARVEWSLGEECSFLSIIEAVYREAKRLGATHGKWRASVTYSGDGVEGIRLIPYQLPQITGFQLIDIQENFYAKKWADRTRFDQYKAALPQGIEPIFVLDGKVTDTSFTNIIVERNGLLDTSDTPLLQGTKRHKLLTEKSIQAVHLGAEELSTYDRIHLINAMVDPGELIFPTSAIL